MECIHYKKGYKYQLTEYHEQPTNIYPTNDIRTEYISLFTNGYLYIKKGYAWDGPSGPTFDAPTFMRASLVHDALYQLMRMGLLSQSKRGPVDSLMRDICLADGMWKVRAWWCFKAVRKAAASAADPKNVRPVLTAP